MLIGHDRPRWRRGGRVFQLLKLLVRRMPDFVDFIQLVGREFCQPVARQANSSENGELHAYRPQ